MASKVRFDDVRVGDQMPELRKVVKREEVKAYADASGDHGGGGEARVRLQQVQGGLGAQLDAHKLRRASAGELARSP